MKVTSCRFHTGAEDRSRFPADGRPEVAFLGRSNVGKSSLINDLLGGTPLARVSGTPGRTQQVHFYLVNELFFLVDLPGYGYAKVPARVRERLTDLIEAYLAEREPLAAAFLLVDSRHEPMAADLAMGAWLRARSIRFELVLTKIDKLPRAQRRSVREGAARAFLAENVVIHSSKTGEGRKDLWQIIDRRIGSVRTGR